MNNYWVKGVLISVSGKDNIKITSYMTSDSQIKIGCSELSAEIDCSELTVGS